MSVWKQLNEGFFYLYAPAPTNCEYQRNTSITYTCESVTYVGETNDNHYAFRRRNGEMLYLQNTLDLFESIQPKLRR